MKIFKIEKGIPLPDKNERKRIFPLDDMQVGDSFALEPYEMIAARSTMSAFKKTNPSRKFTMHEDPKTLGLFRIWRLQ